MYIISLHDDTLKARESTEPAHSPLQPMSAALEVMTCGYEVIRGSDEATVNDEERWDLTPYPLDRITGTTLSLG